MKPLPKRFTGDHPIVPALNRILENLEERTPQDGTTCQFDRRPNGFLANPRVTADADGQAERFRFVRQYKDYIVAKHWTVTLSETAPGRAGLIGTAEETEIRIAKPDEVKTSNYFFSARVAAGLNGSLGDYNYEYLTEDGSERRATLIDGSEFGAGSITSDQEIYPPYIENESLILAMKVKQGSLMKVTETVDGAPQDFTIDYIELPGRKFINKERKIRVCIEGQGGSWFALFRPSGAFREE